MSGDSMMSLEVSRNPRPTPLQRDASTASQRTRTSTACQICRDKKVKCSGERPCKYCERRSLCCVFPNGHRKRPYSATQIEALEQRLAFYEVRADRRDIPINPQQTQTLSLDQPSVIQVSPGYSCYSTEPIASEVANCGGQANIINQRGLKRRQSWRRRDESNANLEEAAICTDLALSSSENFGLEVRGLQSPSSCHSRTLQDTSPVIGEDFYELREINIASCLPSLSEIRPPEEEAYKLLESVLAYIGQSLHPFDSRAFSDRLSTFYKDPNYETCLQDLEITQILLVFALGIHIEGKPKGEVDLPGGDLFLRAMKRVPDLVKLRCSGTLGIEVMGLTAFFLQSSDRKEDAYIYWGMALQIAKSQLLYRSSQDERMLRSEKIHRNRLWWTVYMQERRIAAALGHPSNISDDAIDAEPPSDAPGFSSALPIQIKVRVTRITGCIMDTVYGNRRESQSTFVSKVQRILSDLYAIARNMPRELEVDFNKSDLQISRTSASLHLMLFQSIILTIRPVFLHLVKNSVKGTARRSTESLESPFRKLAATCVTAAKRSLTVLQALVRQAVPSTFGIFDLDAAFSVVFILLLGQACLPNESLADHIDQGNDILRYLASHGANAAYKRIDEVEKMRLNLSRIIAEQPVSRRQAIPETGTQGRSLSQPLHVEEATGIETQHTTSGDNPGAVSIDGAYNSVYPDAELSSSMDWFHLPSFDSSTRCGDGDLVDTMNIEPLESGNDIYSLYHDPTLSLTGVDLADWEELDRQVNWQSSM